MNCSKRLLHEAQRVLDSTLREARQREVDTQEPRRQRPSVNGFFAKTKQAWEAAQAQILRNSHPVELLASAQDLGSASARRATAVALLQCASSAAPISPLAGWAELLPEVPDDGGSRTAGLLALARCGCTPTRRWRR